MRDITQGEVTYHYDGQIEGVMVFRGGACEFNKDGSMAPTKLYVLRHGRVVYSRRASELSAKGWSGAEWS